MSALSRCFNFRGVRVRVETDSVAVAASLVRDFSWFAELDIATAPKVSLTVWTREPPWDDTPTGRCVLVQPGCVVYESANGRWVDYQGRALCHWRYADQAGTLWSKDPELAHEIAYLLILSRVGELLDLQGVHRLHALGLAVGERGVLVFLPSGGGKTTLGMLALRSGRARLLSDDTPLVTRTGQLLSFPCRIGLAAPPPEDVPPRFVREFPRRERDPKWLIDIEAYRDQIVDRARPAAVVLGERLLRGQPSIQRIPRWRAAPELFRSAVVGLGLPQVVEYFLRGDLPDVGRKGGIVASRTAACLALLGRANTYRFALGRDAVANGAVLDAFLTSLQ